MRLRPLTDELPKPLVPVGERPLLLAIVEKLLEAGAALVVVNVHHQALKISSALEGLHGKVHVQQETAILGTAGGIAAARSRFRHGPVLVVNGDIFGEIPAARLLEGAGSGLTLAVSPPPNPDASGTVGLTSGGYVARLRGETFGPEEARSDYRGMCVLGPQILDRLPARGCLIGDVALPMLRKGERVDTCRVEGRFWDVGTPTEYLAANLAWLKLNRLDFFAGAGAHVSPRVTLRQCVVGEGAVVSGEGPLDHCVVWPGAKAHAPLSHAVVTTQGTIVRTRPA